MMSGAADAPWVPVASEGLAGQSPAEEQRGLEQRLQKLRVRELQARTKKQNAQNTMYGICAFCIINAMMILFALCGNSWHHARYTGVFGTGASMISLRSSIFSFKVDINCKKMPGEAQFCRAFSKRIEGTYSFDDFRAHLCALDASSCSAVDGAALAAWAIIVSFPAAILCYVFAAGLLYYYWFDAPTPRIRKYAERCIIAGPSMTLLGLFLWMLTTPNMSEFPPAWNSLSLQILTRGRSAYTISTWVPYGWCVFWAAVWTIAGFVNIIVWRKVFIRHDMEEQMFSQADVEEEIALLTGQYGAAESLAPTCGGFDPASPHNYAGGGAASALGPSRLEGHQKEHFGQTQLGYYVA
eukprot:TRINITY_DN75868_c0_g1_i1.p1 TRINITY_DN75868_c0_g1~~TRINITY_DN75868_c0_g1_i1.p1  ORF type:complete len:354 (-),score=50.39 TRINITY_DN75868_c0_g1_i1:321-1382(-)